MPRKYSPSASKDVEREMHKFKRGQLKSGRVAKAEQSKAQTGHRNWTFGGTKKGKKFQQKRQ
jgi:hypothetical protein